ncbi:MAG: pyridoxal kinase PdxY [Actinomycetales bacterium]
MQILSIQSWVAYGHAGNSSATFTLQRLGHEVWSVPTVNFSNHTGYGAWRGPVIDTTDVAEVIRGIEDRGVFGECDAVLSGYQGAEAVGGVILDAVRRVKAANPAAIYCCDPVMGDVGRGFFVREGIPEFLRDTVVRAADIVTPNLFELEFLTGHPPGSLHTEAQVLAAARSLRAHGPSTVLVTSVITDDTPPDTIGMLAVDEQDAWLVHTPLLPLTVNGAGDATAAMFCAHTLTDGPHTALERTAASIHGVLEATVQAGRREIALIPAQDELVAPRLRVDAHRLG